VHNGWLIKFLDITIETTDEAYRCVQLSGAHLCRTIECSAPLFIANGVVVDGDVSFLQSLRGTSTFKLIHYWNEINRNEKFEIREKEMQLLDVTPHPVMMADSFE
jgi:hypothetical protein